MRKSIPEIEVVDMNSTKKFSQRLKSSILTYFSMSSISSLYHLTIHGKFHRLLWLVLIVISMVSCYFVTTSIYEAREVIILNERNAKSTYDIPFPAVTVCTTVKADHRKINYHETNMKVQRFEANEEEYVAKLC